MELSLHQGRPGSVGLKLDVEVGVLRVGDLQRWRVGRFVQQVLGDVAPVQRQPHLRACAATCQAHMPAHVRCMQQKWRGGLAINFHNG